MSSSPATQNITVRRATPADAEICGRICYEAFTKLNQHHNFPPDFPSPEVAAGVLSRLFANPRVFCVVAEQHGQILGSNCMDERSQIAGIGPITVDPTGQNSGVGRLLMKAVMDRAAEQRCAGVRLVQAAFHSRSMSLYAKLGFDIREPLVAMQGTPIQHVPSGHVVRPALATDLDACDTLCRRVHGHDPLRRTSGCDCTGYSAGSRARWSDHGIRDADRLLRSCCRGRQCRASGADRRSRRICRTGPSAAHAQHRAFSLVPASRPESHPATHAHVLWAVQRAGWGVLAFDIVLVGSYPALQCYPVLLCLPSPCVNCAILAA